ncbi:hypothetical protein [Calothrix sp. CCY 0018]|uniref:hypothetical protein n=1 Tax=Calothrix sp. CCY 0018 TaxID=3103864 RepID=UPI0039C6BEF7
MLLFVLSPAGLVTVTGLLLSVFLQALTLPGLQITIPLLRLITLVPSVCDWLKDEFPVSTLVFKIFEVRVNSERLEVAACAEFVVRVPVTAKLVRVAIPIKVAF